VLGASCAVARNFRHFARGLCGMKRRRADEGSHGALCQDGVAPCAGTSVSGAQAGRSSRRIRHGGLRVQSLRNTLELIRSRLSGLTPTAKLLAGSLVIIVAMGLFLVAQWSAAV